MESCVEGKQTSLVLVNIAYYGLSCVGLAGFSRKFSTGVKPVDFN